MNVNDGTELIRDIMDDSSMTGAATPTRDTMKLDISKTPRFVISLDDTTILPLNKETES